MGSFEHLAEGFIETLAFGIELAAAAILIGGALNFIGTIGLRMARGERTMSIAFAKARVHLGAYILAGLEFLIVADILFTIVNRTLEDVVVLAIVAGVRTLISVFLNKELKELQEEATA